MRTPLSIAASTRRLDVDNSLSLAYYYRIAGNMLKQARVYRQENNIVDLYIILLRFSSLVSETIPRHKDYPTYVAKEKSEYKKRLWDVMNELEALKPEVQRQVAEVNRNYANYDDGKGYGSNGQSDTFQDLWKDNKPGSSRGLHYRKIEDQLSKLSLHIPRPREETLSRHSFLGLSGLQSQWKQSSSYATVQYPGHIDFSTIEIPSLDQVGQTSPSTSKFGSSQSPEIFGPDTNHSLDFDARPLEGDGSPYLSSTSTSDRNMHVHIVRQPSPSPVLAYVENLPGLDEFSHVSYCNDADPRAGPVKPLRDHLSQSESLQYIQISTKMMEDFMKLANSNTEKNLETCGVLAGSLKKRTFYVTSLILPKQESTSDSCQTMNEEEIYAVQDERSLFPLGWIHTHPTQSCFLSSVDLHTHYSYQIMLSEAIAIVMAPTDKSRTYGIFRLTDPGGIKVLKQCQQRGFHPHEEPSDGSPLYDHCSHVLMNPNLKFDIIDLR